MGRLRGLFGSLPFRLLALVLAGAGIAAAGVRLAGVEGTLRYRDLPVVTLAMPPPERIAGNAEEPRGGGAPPVPAEPPAAGAPPTDPLPGLLEPGPWGAVPVVGRDGRSAFSAYRRAAPETADRPRLALVLTGLGLDRAATELAVATPSPIGLVFSPYTKGAAAWLRLARWRGHETLLELPLRPRDFPRDDAGPLSLAPAMPQDLRADRLLAVLAKGPGAFALAARPGAFAAAPEAFRPVADELARRGLGLLELGDGALREVARLAGLPYARAAIALDEEPTPEALDRAFGTLEARALEEGAALGRLRPLPLSLQRLAQWLPGLPAKGFVLVPPSALFE